MLRIGILSMPAANERITHATLKTETLGQALLGKATGSDRTCLTTASWIHPSPVDI